MTQTSLATTASATTASAHATPLPASSPSLSRAGLAAAAAAFVIWGLFPIYLAGLSKVSALEITAHRILWSVVFVLGWLGLRGELGKIRAALAREGILLRLFASAALITINWLAFVWAVTQNHVMDVSLGYYINPLVNVLLGIFILSERLNRVQWIAVALAAVGVTYLAADTGHIPWAALAVAISFAFYGLIRKTANVEALPGLAIELVILLPLAAGYLIWREAQGVGSLGGALVRGDAFTVTLLVFSGLITALPLYLFSYGARLIPYSTVGVIQYIAPSMQLATAVFYFREPFEHGRAVGFGMIWLALVVYAGDGLWRARALTRPKS
jgi:chloramphenicol-sensitive protein RarD